MVNYIIKRLLGVIPILLGITVISFLMMHLAPGKPTDLATDLNPKVSFEVRERLTKLYGLDKPFHTQYINWLSRVSRLDFGRSFVDDRPVAKKIAERLPITITINILSLILILSVAIPLGIAAAVKQDSAFDRFTTVFVFIGFSMPTFWLALILMSFFGITLQWLPVAGIASLDFENFSLAGKIADFVRHLILPVFISGFVGLAGISRYMRTGMLEVLHQDYIRTARAKGLSERAVIYKHALKNALLPITTILGLSIPGLIGGSVIFESIFAIPGMGKLFYDSVMARDYPVIMGILVIGAVLTLAGNLLADIVYSYVDPRIRQEGAA